MKSDNRTRAYQWLIKILRRSSRGLTLKEINELWTESELSDGITFSNSSFKRYKEACFSIFGVLIECDKKTYKYFIANKSDEEHSAVYDYMMRSLSIGKVLNDSQRIYNRILLEPMPSDEFIGLIITAMNRCVRIELEYQEYGSSEAELIVAEPYALKTYHHRWYLLGRLTDGDMRIISLDCVNKVTQTKERFLIDEDFDAKEYFSEYYAVRLDRDVKLQRVVLRAHRNERFIFDKQPIHWTQNKIREEDTYTDFEYYLRPTFDFVSYLESQGRYVEVISPKWLREELLRVHREAMEQNKM